MSKKIFSIIVVVIGAIAIISGIISLVSAGDVYAYTSTADTSISFGADYYTESYKAMAKAANNAGDAANAVAAFGESMLTAFGLFFVLSGALVTLVGVKDLLAALADEKAAAPAPAFAPAANVAYDAPAANVTYDAPAAEVFCGNCGTKNVSGSAFCENCGNKL